MLLQSAIGLWILQGYFFPQFPACCLNMASLVACMASGALVAQQFEQDNRFRMH